MNTTLREALEFSDNPFQLNPPSSGIGSFTTLLGHVTGQTKTSRFDFDADVTYRKYWGPAAAVGGSLAETNDGGFKLHYETFGKTPGDRNYIDGIWRQQSLSTAILNDIGVPLNVRGNIQTTTAIGGINRSLSATDFFTLSARATSTDYQPQTAGLQYYDLAATSTLRHQSNSTSALTALTEFEWLKYNNNAETNVKIIRYMSGVDLKPFNNMTVVASGGAATVMTELGQSAENANQLLFPAASGPTTSFIGDARITYQIFPTTVLAATAGQSIGPTITGALAKRQYAGGDIQYSLSAMETFSTRADFTRQTIASSQSDFFTTSATYSRILARDWTLDMTYRYSQRLAATGTSNLTIDPLTGLPIALAGVNQSNSTSNSILIAISKRFILLPKRS